MARFTQTERWRRAIDSWVGTLTQVIGMGLLLYALGIDRLSNPALLPAAIGLLGLKYVAGGKS